MGNAEYMGSSSLTLASKCSSFSPPPPLWPLLPPMAPQPMVPPQHTTQPLLTPQLRSSPPQPYAYEYGVADDYSKANFKKTETQDAEGKVAGSFTIALPDGRIQTTTYTADHYNGFIAEVTYEGTAVYPPEPAAGYGHAAPAYPARN